MKRLALAAIAAATFAAPLAIVSPAFADDDHRGRHERGWDDRRHDRDDNWDDRRHYRDGYRDGRRADRQHEEWRHERRLERWDDRRYNGYWHEGRWFYGPPPHHYRDVRYDHRQWRRGDRLPRYYYDRFERVDYRHHRLRPPPRDCYYLYDRDRDEYLLVGIATGVILGVILGG